MAEAVVGMEWVGGWKVNGIENKVAGSTQAEIKGPPSCAPTFLTAGCSHAQLA